jgi:hypothetical protein
VIPCSIVVGDLDRAAALGLADRVAHRLRLLLGVHDTFPGTLRAMRPIVLDQRRLAAQDALLAASMIAPSG